MGGLAYCQEQQQQKPRVEYIILCYVLLLCVDPSVTGMITVTCDNSHNY